MRFVCLGIVVGLLLASTSVLAGPSGAPCKHHTDCSDLEVCHAGSCESAVGRTYTVTVLSGKVSEKRMTMPAQGKAWDALGGLPDPRVHVYFPSMSKLAFVAGGKKDTTSPVWNVAQNIVVTAAGQEIWFCFYDQDSGSHDAMMTDSAGNSNCTGYKNVVDLIRNGVLEMSSSGDVRAFKARIDRK